MTYIINPTNLQKHSVYSKQGKQILKKYLQTYLQKKGGMNWKKMKKNWKETKKNWNETKNWTKKNWKETKKNWKETKKNWKESVDFSKTRGLKDPMDNWWGFNPFPATLPSSKHDVFGRELDIYGVHPKIKQQQIDATNLIDSIRSALMCYLSYKNTKFIKDAMKNKFYKGILGDCELTLFHERNSDVRLLYLNPLFYTNDITQKKPIYAIRGTAMGKVGKVGDDKNELNIDFNPVDMLADAFIGVLGFQKYGKLNMKSMVNIVRALSSSLHKMYQLSGDPKKIIKYHGIYQSNIAQLYDKLLTNDNIVTIVIDENGFRYKLTLTKKSFLLNKKKKDQSGQKLEFWNTLGFTKAGKFKAFLDPSLKAFLDPLISLLNKLISNHKELQNLYKTNKTNKNEKLRQEILSKSIDYICTQLQNPNNNLATKIEESTKVLEKVSGEKDNQAQKLRVKLPKLKKSVSNLIKNVRDLSKQRKWENLIFSGFEIEQLISEFYNEENKKILEFLLKLNINKVKSIRKFILKHQKINNNFGGKLVITGHSLGGYLAYITHLVLENPIHIKTITFNQPFTGEMGFEDFKNKRSLFQKAWDFGRNTVNKGIGGIWGKINQVHPSILKFQYEDDIVSLLDTDKLSSSNKMVKLIKLSRKFMEINSCEEEKKMENTIMKILTEKKETKNDNNNNEFMKILTEKKEKKPQFDCNNCDDNDNDINCCKIPKKQTINNSDSKDREKRKKDFEEFQEKQIKEREEREKKNRKTTRRA